MIPARTRVRPAYTLLEVILALAIAVLLLAAVYSVVGYHLRQAQAGRDVIERTTIARAVLNRISRDVSAAISLGDPARFRRQQSASDPASAETGGTPTSGSTPTPPPDPGMASTGMGMTTTVSSPMEAEADPALGIGSGPVQVPLGVLGTSTELHLFISKVPTEVYGPDGEPGQLTSDLRRVSYWIGGEGQGGGLCRLELPLITSEEATLTELPEGDFEQYLLAPEVQSIEFSYFDGSGWVDSWDSTAVGDDGMTPMGSPRAIAITVGLVPPYRGTEAVPELKYLRHVVFIPTAGGTPLQTTSEGGATTP